MKSISVITTVYNTPTNYLRKYFESLLNQEFDDFEIIIIDDGSTNKDTIDMIDYYVDKFADKIKLERHDRNKGISYCRNCAFKLANSLYFTVLDSDDWYDANFLKIMYQVAKEKEADMVICGYRLCDENGIQKSEEPKQISMLDNLEYQYATTIGARLVRLSIIKDNGLLYPNDCLVEDLPFNTFLTYLCRNIQTTRCFGYNIRIHLSSTSHDTVRYSRLTLDNSPIYYIERYVKMYTSFSNDDKKVFYGNLIMILSAISCIWCRNNEKTERKEICKLSADIIRNEFPNYIFASFYYYIHGTTKSFVMLYPFLFSIFVFLKIEFVFANLLNLICNRIINR